MRHALTVVGLFFLCLVLGISILPSAFLLKFLLSLHIHNDFVYTVIICLGVGTGYILFGLFLLFVLILIRKTFDLNSSPITSSIQKASVAFGAYHALFAIAETFFLPLIRGTFILSAFYKGLGMKIGKNTIINTLRISDCNLIEIGNDCIIGGDVIINGHSAERQTLHKGRVKIGNNVSIGSYSTILCGVTIEDNVTIGANSLVPKNTCVNQGVYGGVPIHELSKRQTNFETINSRQERDQIDLLKNDEHYVSVLNSQYQNLHAEILGIETFLTQVFTSSFGILFSLLIYSIVESKLKTILIIAPLATLSAAILMSTTTAMLRVAFKMAETEIYFQAAGYKMSNWENKYGALGLARIRELDGVLILVIYGVLICGGIYLTISNEIVTWDEFLFSKIKTKTVLLFINGFLGLWLCFSLSYYFFKVKKLRSMLDEVRSQLSIRKDI